MTVVEINHAKLRRRAEDWELVDAMMLTWRAAWPRTPHPSEVVQALRSAGLRCSLERAANAMLATYVGLHGYARTRNVPLDVVLGPVVTGTQEARAK